MKQIKSKLLILAFAILTLIAAYFFVYYYNNQDIKDIKVEGYVLDSNNSEPLENVIVTVINERYENDNGYKNYDEYLGQDKIELKTNSKGYYSIILKKSAYVYVLLQKDGYRSLEEKGKQAQRLLTFKTNMSKTDRKTTQ